MVEYTKTSHPCLCMEGLHENSGNNWTDALVTSVSRYTRMQKLGVSRWHNPKLATTVQLLGLQWQRKWNATGTHPIFASA